MGEWIPLYINPSNLKVSVLGGGRLGTRRALHFCRAGAQVRVYSLDFSEELVRAQCEGLELIEADLSREEALRAAIEWADLVVIATGDREVDGRASRLALSMRKLVNNGVDALSGNVIVPFSGETSYGLKFAVTSLGATGIAARQARDMVFEVLEDNTYIRTLYRVMARIKRWLKSNIPNAKERLPLYFIVEEDKEFVKLVGEGREEEAFERAIAVVMEELSQARG